MVNIALSGFTRTHINPNANKFVNNPKTRACDEGILSLTKGLFLEVRDIIESISFSKYWLIALAPAAARDPPNSTIAIRTIFGTPCFAKNIPPTDVINNSIIILGFVNAIYAFNVERKVVLEFWTIT